MNSIVGQPAVPLSPSLSKNSLLEPLGSSPESWPLKSISRNFPSGTLVGTLESEGTGWRLTSMHAICCCFLV